MKKNFFAIGTALLAALLIGSCGGSSGSGGGPSSTATVSTLSSVPNVDLSNYDSSTSSSANLTALFSKSVGIKGLYKGLGENLTAEGKTSRGGCEANMHKKMMIRESQMAQLDRCYPEAMEAAGLITIPTGSRNQYIIKLPEMEEEELANMCDGIPAEDAEARQACLNGEAGGKSGQNMLMRIGIIDGELQIDMCEGKSGSESLINEATYSASTDTYAANITRIGAFAGQSEAMSFDMSVKLGSGGSVSDGLVTLGSDGSADATSVMDGGYGSGRMRFEHIGSDSSNRIRGVFNSSFTDSYTNKASSFTGKVYARFGGSSATGCAKYSFEGSEPPMRIVDMIPFDISENDLANFLSAFGTELGIKLTADNYESIYLCQNSNFDPASPSSNIKPMIEMTGDTCPSVTHTGIECFGISNAKRTGQHGTWYKQSFTIIANSASTYYDEVNAFDLDGIDSTVTAPAFSRNWDCSGDFEELNIGEFSAETFAAIESVMNKCFELEEKLFDNGGMSEYNCGEQQQRNGIDDFADGGGQDFGTFGGDYEANPDAGSNTCPDDDIPEHLFVDAIDPDNNQYCFPVYGACNPFTVVGTTGTPDDAANSPILIDEESSSKITQVVYNDSTNPTSAVISISSDQGSCDYTYIIHTPEGFTAPGEFEGEGVPDPCHDPDTGDPIPEDACRQLCMDPKITC